jgi:serine/threonine protein kinase/tetratricopeptide (TPR) repeat protein
LQAVFPANIIGFMDEVTRFLNAADRKSRLSERREPRPKDLTIAETADRTESLFAAAVALPPDERGAYLQRECPGDPALRDRVLALLRAHDRAGHVIDRPVNGDPDQTAGYAPASEQPGTMIAGRYKLLEEIGQGGMGTVWATEQMTPVRRKVALKLIKAGMDSRSVLARFEAERQALALMDHANIAKVLDGGLTESGRPYFVMEYVKGVPITEYCDRTCQSVEERLNLFVQVCSALQHAHQKGIIHRDLKPSNILVAPYDDKPVPKVIDFGLAKAIHQSLTEKTLFTAHEMVVGTPLYMSPEQAQLNNLDVDTRADIYSLGVLLYELLTGTTPLERRRFKEAAWEEIRRMIREEEPPRPSMRLSSTDTLPSLAAFRHTEPEKLKKLVRGELDWIVMKALEKDRTRRYETASGLARDIQRYLDDEVVEARPPSPGYRFGKFVRRHRGQVIAAGMVLLALLAGIAGTTWGLIREASANARLAESLTREQKTNAELAAANAKVEARFNLAVEAIKTFHTGVSEDFLLKEEKFKDLRDRLLKSAADFYGKLSARLGNETDFTSRRALAQSNFELAELTRKVGRSEDALAAHRSVLSEREALAAEHGADASLKADVGRSLTEVAFLLSSIGRGDESLATYRRSETLLAAVATHDTAARAALAACRSRMGLQLYYSGRVPEALAALERARAEQEALAAVPDTTNGARRELAESVSTIGYLLWNSGKVFEAEPVFREALAMSQKLADENPDVTEFRFRRASVHFYLGNVLSTIGRLAEGEAELRTALAQSEDVLRGNPAVNRVLRAVGLARCYLGELLTAKGEPADAEAEYRKAMSEFQKLVDSDPGLADNRSDVGMCRRCLGTLLLQMGKPSAAEAECRMAVEIQQKLADLNSTVAVFRERLAINLNALGDVERSRGRMPEAKDAYERALHWADSRAREYPQNATYRSYLASWLWRRGLALRDLADLAGAAADVRRAQSLSEGLPPGLLHQIETACCHAALASLAGRAGSGVSAAEGEEAVAKAMERLGRAVASGYRNTNQLRIESALDPLRDRADFKKLVAELEKNSPPKQAKK